MNDHRGLCQPGRVAVTIVLTAVGTWLHLAAPTDVYAASPLPALPETRPAPVCDAPGHVLIGWSDTGMHFMSERYEDLAILAPGNTLRAQLVRRDRFPELVTAAVTVTYAISDNTYSAGKLDFWTYADRLFGRQIARLVAADSAGPPLAETQIVAPVSVEMHCDTCHDDSSRLCSRCHDGNRRPPGGGWEANVLYMHDVHEGTKLMTSRPVLCAECHASAAIDERGKPGMPSLSRVMHGRHARVGGGGGDDAALWPILAAPDQRQQARCQDCHPGTQTRPERDVMATVGGLVCTGCHGGLSALAKASRKPWADLPRCVTCHQRHGENTSKLYSQSSGHGGVYCAACHGSAHGVLPSGQADENGQSIALQGHAGTLTDCRVCHLTVPAGPGPHGVRPTATEPPPPTETPTETPSATPTPTDTPTATATPLPPTATDTFTALPTEVAVWPVFLPYGLR